MSQFDQDVDLTDKVVLAKAVHQLLSTESTEIRNTIQAKLSVICKCNETHWASCRVQRIIHQFERCIFRAKIYICLMAILSFFIHSSKIEPNRILTILII